MVELKADGQNNLADYGMGGATSTAVVTVVMTTLQISFLLDPISDWAGRTIDLQIQQLDLTETDLSGMAARCKPVASARIT